MNLPGEQIKWRILETDGSGPLLSATYNVASRPLSTVNFACLLQITAADVEDCRGNSL
jgi:hypothetical protein